MKQTRAGRGPVKNIQDSARLVSRRENSWISRLGVRIERENVVDTIKQNGLHLGLTGKNLFEFIHRCVSAVEEYFSKIGSIADSDGGRTKTRFEKWLAATAKLAAKIEANRRDGLFGQPIKYSFLSLADHFDRSPHEHIEKLEEIDRLTWKRLPSSSALREAASAETRPEVVLATLADVTFLSVSTEHARETKLGKHLRRERSPERRRGRPDQSPAYDLALTLTAAYGLATGNVPTLGNDAEWSPYAKLVGDVLVAIGDRPPDSVCRPEAARSALSRRRTLLAELYDFDENSE